MSHREEIRATLRAMSDEAIMYQAKHGAPGGLQREEIDREVLVRFVQVEQAKHKR